MYLLLCQPLCTVSFLAGPRSLSVLGVCGRCCWCHCHAPLLWALHKLLVPIGFGSAVSASAFHISLLMQQTLVLRVSLHTSYRSLCCSFGLWLLASGLSWRILAMIRYVMSECCPLAINFFLERETSLSSSSNCFEKCQSCLPSCFWGCFKFLMAI